MSQMPDEETALLACQPQHEGSTNSRTPIPWHQFSIILLLHVSEVIMTQFIVPFLPQLIRDIGITDGQDSRIGYYVGLMNSLSYLAEACTVFYWSRLSDKIGRKPVLLIGLFGQSLSMWCFGLSKSFWSLVASLCFNGALNGNIGIKKSIIIEMMDSTNMAHAFGYLPLTRALGTALGSLIGGFLARPAEGFPTVFGDSEFLKKYPYFLACAAPATFMAFSGLISLMFLKETLKSRRSSLREHFFGGVTRGHESISDSRDNSAAEAQLPIRALLTRPVLIAIGSYATLSLLSMALYAITPVFYAIPIWMGGLHLDPPAIGTILAFFGIPGAIIQWMFFAPMHDYFGAKATFLGTVSLFLPVVSMFPMMNAIARLHGSGYYLVRFFLGFQRFLLIFGSLAFEIALMYVGASAPNKESIGATNGIAQTIMSLICVIGPVLVNSAFSFSIERHVMGGYLAYWVMAIMVMLTLQVGYMLPRNMWNK